MPISDQLRIKKGWKVEEKLEEKLLKREMKKKKKENERQMQIMLERESQFSLTQCFQDMDQKINSKDLIFDPSTGKNIQLDELQAEYFASPSPILKYENESILTTPNQVTGTNQSSYSTPFTPTFHATNPKSTTSTSVSSSTLNCTVVPETNVSNSVVRSPTEVGVKLF